MFRLVDTHAHLEEIQNLERAIVEAKSAGVIAIIAVGSDYESNQRVLELAQTYKGFVHPAVGWHPWNIAASEIDRNLNFIEFHINEAVAIGEIGLDYHKKVRAKAEKDLQKDVLQQILKIAGAHDKPVLIHSRYAWQDSLTLVKEAGLTKAVFHWYTGTSSVLREIVAKGYFISATPAVEYHEEHRRAIKESPLERLLLETDSPVVYQRGRESEFEAKPADVLRALKGTAKLKGITEAEVAEITTQNALSLFAIGNTAEVPI